MSKKRLYECDGAENLSDSDHEDIEIVDSVVGLELKSVNTELKRLNKEQEAVLKKALDGHNVFYTGAAGTGKSLLTSRIVSGLMKQSSEYGERKKKVWVVAPTGLAATNVGGLTIHMQFGVVSFEHQLEEILKHMPRERKYEIALFDTLLIDEISMVSSEIMEKLDKILKSIRSSDLYMADSGVPEEVYKKNYTKCFGGVQVIVTGDFFQLPPVVKGKKDTDDIFAFQTALWNRLFKKNLFALSIIYRQKDTVFVKVLNSLRIGVVTQEVVDFIDKLSLKTSDQIGEDCVILFSKVYMVKRYNEMKLSALLKTLSFSGSRPIGDFLHVYSAVDSDCKKHGIDPNFIDYGIPDSISLCFGAKVLCVANIDQDEGIVNGIRGQIIGFEDSVYDKDAQDDVQFKQALPKVRFSLPDGSTKDRIIDIYSFKVETLSVSGEKVVVERKQIPLITAWAFTIHKSQGMSIKDLVVDLSEVFSAGQMYVALSRAVSVQGLRVLNFHPKALICSKAVKEFYVQLEKNMKRISR